MKVKNVVNITFDPVDFEHVRQYAKANGISLAGFIRMSALRAISKGD